MDQKIDYLERARALDLQLRNLRSRGASDQDRVEAIAAAFNQVASHKSNALIQSARALAMAVYGERPALRNLGDEVMKVLTDRK